MKIIGVVQARMKSMRFPGKVLAPIGSRPAILRLFNRLKKVERVKEWVLATTSDSTDDVLVNLVEKEGVFVLRGSEANVLSRFKRIGELRKADVLVRITGDCPLHDPTLIDQMVDFFVAGNQTVLDYLSNVHPPTLPDGYDIEIFTVAALRRLRTLKLDFSEEEHVTIGFLKRKRELSFVTHSIDLNIISDDSDLRVTLDYQDDLEVLNRMAGELDPIFGEDNFGWKEVVRFLRERHQIRDLNLPFRRSAFLID